MLPRLLFFIWPFISTWVFFNNKFYQDPCYHSWYDAPNYLQRCCQQFFSFYFIFSHNNITYWDFSLFNISSIWTSYWVSQFVISLPIAYACSMELHLPCILFSIETNVIAFQRVINFTKTSFWMGTFKIGVRYYQLWFR